MTIRSVWKFTIPSARCLLPRWWLSSLANWRSGNAPAGGGRSYGSSCPSPSWGHPSRLRRQGLLESRNQPRDG